MSAQTLRRPASVLCTGAALVLSLTTACGGEKSGAMDTTVADSSRRVDTTGTTASRDGSVGLLEGYPAAVIATLDARSAALLRNAQATAQAQQDAVVQRGMQSAIAISKRWDPGEVVTVAFRGGTPALRARIADAVTAWSQAGNVRFDFWTDASHTTFREWTPSDASYQAHVRIGFADAGYWSQIGRDAIDDRLSRPGEPSLNLAGFDEHLPPDWRKTTLHEFGHALGFLHEHQSPTSNCESEFRWQDDQGYVPTHDAWQQMIPDALGRRPGIYTLLGGAPNNWTTERVDFNLRRFAMSTDMRASGFDRRSIMKYYFPPAMFVSGAGSACYSAPNIELSEGDRRAMAEEYPSEIAAAPAVTESVAVDVRSALGQLRLSPAARERLGDRLLADRARLDATSATIP